MSKKTKLSCGQLKSSVNLVISYEVNFTNHQLCTHSLCIVGLRNSAVTFQIEVAHSWPVC